jgi:signal transduction histidine kinase
VVVRIGISPRRVDVEAFDDGVGFDPASSHDGKPHGTGLSVMRERTEQLGGQFFLTSTRNRGTCMRLWVPLPKRHEPS